MSFRSTALSKSDRIRSGHVTIHELATSIRGCHRTDGRADWLPGQMHERSGLRWHQLQCCQTNVRRNWGRRWHVGFGRLFFANTPQQRNRKFSTKTKRRYRLLWIIVSARLIEIPPRNRFLSHLQFFCWQLPDAIACGVRNELRVTLCAEPNKKSSVEFLDFAARKDVWMSNASDAGN